MFVVMGILLTMGSCKKEKNLNPDQNTVLTKEELIPYYIVVEHKLSNNKIGLIYFTKQGNNVKAIFHGEGYSQTGDISINGQGFSFDSGNDGNYVYNFTFDKDADGKFMMKSYQFIDKTSISQGLNYAIIARKEDAPVFENKNFITTERIRFMLRNENNTPRIEWDIKPALTFPYLDKPAFSKPYTILNNLGWKDNEGTFMGISVPGWKDNTKTLMLVESGNTLYLAKAYSFLGNDD